MLIADTESPGLKYEADKIWVCAANRVTDGLWSFSFDKSVYEQFDVKALLGAHGLKYTLFANHENHLAYMAEHTVCMHNWYGHDKPLINKLFGEFKPKGEEDTFILSQLLNPDRPTPPGCKGPHGLDAWGQRFGVPKPKHEEWGRFSPEMLHRVIEDVKINVLTWEALQKEKEGWDWDKAIRIEYAIAELQGRQELHGVKLDVEKAYALADEIYTEIQKIDEQLLEQMPNRVIQYPEAVYEREPFTKAGKVKKQAEDWVNG